MENKQKEQDLRELNADELGKVNGGVFVPDHPDDSDDNEDSSGGATGGW